MKQSQTYRRLAKTIQRFFFFPLNHLSRSCLADAPLSHILYWVSTNKDNLTYSHNVTHQELTLIHYHHLNSDLIQVSACPSDLLWSKGNHLFRPQLASDVFFISFGLEQLFHLSFAYMTLTHLKIIGKLFYRMSVQSGSSFISSWLDSSYASLAGTSQKGCCILLMAPCQLGHNFNLSCG